MARNTGLGQFYRDRVFARDDYECVRCGATEELTLDHIVPVSMGGSKRSLSNHQTLCYDCNHAKADRSISYLRAAWA